MPRKMRPAPENIMLASTSRGTWVALEEVWSAEGELLELRAMRSNAAEPIIQKRERREILARVENALLKSRLREMERRLNDLTNGGLSGQRYAATG